MASKTTKKLTKKERLFALEYLADEKLNAERAALKAGYAKSVARKKAFNWVGKSGQNEKPHVAEFVEEILRVRLEKLEISGTMVLKEISKIGFSNPWNILQLIDNKKELTIEDLKGIPAELLAGVTEIIVEDGKVRIKTAGKLKALELLGKKFRLWESGGEGTKHIVEVVDGAAEDSIDFLKTQTDDGVKK